MIRLRLLLPITLCALAVVPGVAAAATQVKDDAAGDTPPTSNGYRTDLHQASWDVSAAQVAFELTVTQDPFAGQFYVFLDTDRNGRSDYAIAGMTGGGPDGDLVRFRLETTPDSTATCQRAGGPGNFGFAGQTLAATDPVGPVDASAPRYRFVFPTSLIGGAERFDWAVYGLGFDLFDNRFDYMPDAANYDVDRPNPVPNVKDWCDTNGDGTYGDPGDDAESQGGSVPLIMAQGFAFPDEQDDQPVRPGPGGPGDPTQPGGGSTWPHTDTDTTRRAAMPNVGGLRADKARTKVLAVLGYADFDVREINLAKPPKGIGFGDVVAQRPASGTALTAGIGELPPVELRVYAGPKPQGKKDCIDRLAKEVKGMELVMAADLLKKAGCRISYDLRFAVADKEVVTKVTPRASDRVDVQAQIPKAAAKQDLFLNVRENPNQLSFDAPRPNEGHPGFNLLSSREQRNCITIQVVDRGGRLVRGAQLRIDASDVGAPSDPNVPATNAQGETPVCFLAPKPGRVDIVTWAQGGNDIAIYGGHSFTVVDGSRLKTGDRWFTSSGRVLTKTKSGTWTATTARSRSAHAAATAKTVDYGPLVNWLIALFSGNSQQAVATLSEPTIGAGQKLSSLCGGKAGSCPAVLAVGDGPVGKARSGLISVTTGQVVSAGGANVVSAGGANVVSAGGGNVVSAGGLNLVNGGSAGVVAAGGANVISVGGGNVVSAGGANVVSAGGSNVISAGGANVVSAGGANLFSINNGRLLSDNGLG